MLERMHRRHGSGVRWRGGWHPAPTCYSRTWATGGKVSCLVTLTSLGRLQESHLDSAEKPFVVRAGERLQGGAT